MKAIGRFASFVLVSLTSIVITVTACGGGGASQPGGGGGIGAARALIFNANPVGFHVTRGFGASRASLQQPASFTVNAQTTAAGGGNFSGFCNATFGNATPNIRIHTVVFGLGRWTSGACEDGVVQDTSVGVNIPQNGQIGNLTVDAAGTGTQPDSGLLEVMIIHSDGTRITTPLTCSFGISSGGNVHCEDKNASDHISVAAGDQVAAFFSWSSNGDAYTAIRVNIEYATPTF